MSHNTGCPVRALRLNRYPARDPPDCGPQYPTGNRATRRASALSRSSNGCVTRNTAQIADIRSSDREGCPAGYLGSARLEPAWNRGVAENVVATLAVEQPKLFRRSVLVRPGWDLDAQRRLDHTWRQLYDLDELPTSGRVGSGDRSRFVHAYAGIGRQTLVSHASRCCRGRGRRTGPRTSRGRSVDISNMAVRMGLSRGVQVTSSADGP